MIILHKTLRAILSKKRKIMLADRNVISLYPSLSDVPFDDVPQELLEDAHLDLTVWSIILKDRTLARIGEYNRLKAERDAEERAQRAAEEVRSMAEDGAVGPGGVGSRPESRPRAKQLAPRNILSLLSKAKQNMLADAAPKVEILSWLDMTGASHVTDDGVQMLAKGCANLTHLDISGCFRIGDVGLRSIAMACPLLSTLLMKDCVGISGPGFGSLGECCANITKLSLEGCIQVRQPLAILILNKSLLMCLFA